MGEQRPDLLLPKLAVRVDIAIADGSPTEAELFVAMHAGHSPRRQHLIDLLADEAPFLPARDPRTAEVVFLNKATLAWVGVSLDDGDLPVEEQPDTPDGELYDEECPVRVELVGGGALSGDLLYSQPSGHARAGDYLNERGRFFPLWGTDCLYLVNKALVARVVERPRKGGD